MVDGSFISDGILGPAHDWVRRTAEATRAHGGLYVADEVQAGFGRTGDALWSVAAAGVAPDFVTLGKPMGNGFPVAAVITRADLADPFIEATDYFSTFGGNTVAAAAGLAVLDVIEDERLVERAARARRPAACAAGRAARGRCGALLGADGRASTSARSGRRAIVNALRGRGVLIGVTGPDGGTLKIRPPLVVSDGRARPARRRARRRARRVDRPFGRCAPGGRIVKLHRVRRIALAGLAASLVLAGTAQAATTAGARPAHDAAARGERLAARRGQRHERRPARAREVADDRVPQPRRRARGAVVRRPLVGARHRHATGSAPTRG